MDQSAWRDRVRRDIKPLLTITFVGLAIRTAFVAMTRRPLVGADPIDYDRLGRLLAAGKGLGTALLSPSGGPTAFRPPLYPLFLAAVYKVTGGSITGARLVQALLGVVSIGLLWMIARHLFDRRVALAVAALSAVYLPLIMTTEALMSESILVPLFLASFLTALLARDDTAGAMRWTLLSAALLGLCMLSRPNSAAAAPALIVLSSGHTRTWAWRRGLARAAAFVGVVALVLLPWEIRNYRAFHTFIPVSTIDGFNLAGVYNQDAATSAYPKRFQFRPPNSVAELRPLFSDQRLDEVTLGTSLREAGLDFIKDHPTAPFQAEFWNSYRLLELCGLDSTARAARELGYGRGAAAAGMGSFWLLLACAIGGATCVAARRVPRVVWLVPASVWVGTTLFLGETRMRAPIDPFFILLAGVFLDAAVRHVSRRRQTAAPS